MQTNLFKIKPYDESLGFSILVDLFNQMRKYLNPETTFQITEELAHAILGKESVISRDFLMFENKKSEIIGFAGVAKTPLFNAWLTIYGVLPKYIDSEVPGALIDAILNLGRKLNVPELLFQTIGELSAPFDEKLENIGFSPVNYSWAMRLNDFDFFSYPSIPHGITIQNLKDIDDYASVVTVINEAFADSFQYKSITKMKWKKMIEMVKKNHIVEHCVAYEKNKIVGVCDTYLNLEEDQTGLIANFGVLPSYQHRKIGSVLLASGIETLRKKGCKTIKLSVDTKNEKALGLYKKFGFYVKDNLTEKTYQII